MNRNVKSALFQGLIKFAFFAAACVLLAALGSFAALGQKARGEKAANEVRESQPPLYRDYKGVSIGMTAEEARARLGKPMTKGDDQDFYVISEKETVQVCYDKSLKVVTISVDYLAGSDAPDYKAVVGGDIEVKPDGSMYKLIRYADQGFWVSYYRSASSAAVPTVTITIQKMT